MKTHLAADSFDAFLSYSHATDNRFASQLQTALMRFAKPWYRRRALRVFRDVTNLAATPQLWPTIERAISCSKYFLLLASPAAAQSLWVQKELEYWINNKPVANLLILVTDGCVNWDAEQGDFDWKHTDAVPRSLAGVFDHEPLYVDFSGIRKTEDCSLGHSEFRAAVATICAPIHGKEKDDLDSEDYRRHRQTLRIAWTIAAALLLLTAISAAATAVAHSSRKQAVDARFEAERERDNVKLQLGLNYRNSAISSRDVSEDPLKSSHYFLLAVPNFEQLPTEAQDAHLAGEVIGERAHLTAILDSGQAITDVVFSENMRRAMTSGHGSTHLWDVTTGTMLAHAEHGNDQVVVDSIFDDDGARILCRSGEPILDFSFSPSDDSAEVENVLSVWDVVKGRPVAEIRSDVPFNPRCRFVDNGSRVLSYTGDIFGSRAGGAVQLWDARTGDISAETTHNRGVVFAALTEGENYILSGSVDGVVSLSGLKNGKQMQFKHNDAVYRASLYSDYRRILSVTGSVDGKGPGTVHVWRVDPEELIAQIKHKETVTGTILSPDEQRILSWSDDGLVKLSSAKDGALICQTLHGGEVIGAGFSRSEGTVWSWGRDRIIRQWNSETGETVREIEITDDNASFKVRFDEQEDRVLITTSKSARIHRTSDGHLLAELKHGRSINGADFVQNETCVLTWGADEDWGSARLWNAADGHLLAEMRHSEPVESASILTQDGLVYTRSRGSVRLWRIIEEFRTMKTMEHPGVLGASYDIGEETIVSWGDDAKVRRWDTETGKSLGAIGHQQPVGGVMFSPDGNRAVSWSGVAFVDSPADAHAWETESGQVISTFQRSRKINEAIFTSDGNCLLSSSLDGTVCMWNATTGKVIVEVPHQAAAGAELSHDERKILSWSVDGIVKVWNIENGQALAEIKHESGIHDATFNHDATRVLSCGYDPVIKVWDAKTGNEISRHQHDSRINEFFVSTEKRASFTRDGWYILSWGYDKSVRFWNAQNGSLVSQVNHQGVVTGMSYGSALTGAVLSKKDDLILSWGVDGFVRLTDSHSGESIMRIRHSHPVIGAKFSSDESHILSWDQSGAILLSNARTGYEIMRLSPAVGGAILSRDGTSVLSWGVHSADSKRGELRVTSIGTDYDVPSRLLILRNEVRTGTELDLRADGVRVLSSGEWSIKKRQYKRWSNQSR